MSTESRALVGKIFDQLRALRQRVADLEELEKSEVDFLRGTQTTDVDGAVDLSFMKLQDQIAGMEETLAMIAEATGDIHRL